MLLKTTFGPDNPKHEGNLAVYQFDLRRYVSGLESFAETEPMHQLRDVMISCVRYNISDLGSRV